MAKRSSVNEGRSDTIRCAGGFSCRRADVRHANKTSTTTESLRNTIPPAREPTGGANEDVSWLRANAGPSRKTSQWLDRVWARHWRAPTSRYSGGAAPESHPPPLPPFPNKYSVPLRGETTGRKRQQTPNKHK